MKKSLMFRSSFGGLAGSILALSLIAVPALAQTTATITATTTVSTTATKIACVGAAVATREAAIDAAVTVHDQAVEAAYTTRATELAGAYSNTTAKTVQAGVKVSWADFTKSTRAAGLAWRTTRNAAWTAFRKAATACKAPAGVSDSANSGAEVSGS